MARTSRNPIAMNSMDALDNIDLDDMFADEGDALFDGLDIDLGNMDDITGAASVDDDTNVRTAPLHEQQTRITDDSTRARRTNKRKIRSPVFFDDDDEDYDELHKKKATKKRPPKAAGNQQKKFKAKTSTPPPQPMQTTAPSLASIPAPTPLKSKKSKTTSINVPPSSLQRGAVAAAGQFGNRNKRGTSFTYTLPKSSPGPIKAKPLPAPPNVRAFPVVPPVKTQQQLLPGAALAQLQATHPGLQQGTFCGLLPSNTLFYPFMPTLPNEASLKQRKVFPIVDRIHTSFMTSAISSANKMPATAHITTPITESAPIVALMQECYKEEKPSMDVSEPIQDNHQSIRAIAIATAADETRQAVSHYAKHNVAGDLLAVCSLLKRQHDFLRQNKSNMEEWCKSHFTEQDYASVFLPPKQKAKRKAIEISCTPGNILSSFTKNQIKVKILCSNFVVTSLDPLYAALRAAPKLKEKDAGLPRAKKSKLMPAISTAATSKGSSSPSARHLSKTLSLSYVEMKPARRRKSIVDLVGRSARQIETKYFRDRGEQQQSVDRQQSELQKLIDDDKLQLVHTSGMWRWLEKSGHFARPTVSECQWRLEGLTVPNIGDRPVHRNHSQLQRPGSVNDISHATSSYFQRLQSLLVEENTEDDDSSDEGSVGEQFDTLLGTRPMLDMSGLTLHERTFLHLRSFNLLDDLTKSPKSSSYSPSEDGKLSVPAFQPSTLEASELGSKADRLIATKSDEELSFVIAGMTNDLTHLDDLNSRRTKFLESMCQVQRLHESDAKTKGLEVSLVSRCQQIIKKNRQEKGKNEGKPRLAKNDEYALPW